MSGVGKNMIGTEIADNQTLHQPYLAQRQNLRRGVLYITLTHANPFGSKRGPVRSREGTKTQKGQDKGSSR